MKLIIDNDAKTVTRVDGEKSETRPLYSPEAFGWISHEWVRVGWDQKHPYTFTWLGRPIIQLPEDVLRIQEVIFQLQPDVIIETGVAHGGSLIFYASLCKAMGKGRIVGVDVEIRPHNRKAIEEHPLFPYITLIEGDSVAPEIVADAAAHVKSGDVVLVILDSNHTRDHVLAELEAYHPMVSVGSYIVATDGVMRDVSDVPRGHADWTWNHPAEAARIFAEGHPEFVMEPPAWMFNESPLTEAITHWPNAYLKRIR